MSPSQIPLSLRETIADVLELSPDQIHHDLCAAEVAAWDSFRHLQLILALESTYSVQFNPQEIGDLSTPRRMQEALEEKGAQW